LLSSVILARPSLQPYAKAPGLPLFASNILFLMYLFIIHPYDVFVNTSLKGVAGLFINRLFLLKEKNGQLFFSCPHYLFCCVIKR